MKRLKPKQRRERMRENYRDAMAQTREQAQDPGLRDAYKEIPRAPIRLITCPLGKAINHGGLLRLAEAFRLEGVDFSRERDAAWDSSGGTGAHFWQEMRWIDAADSIPEAKAAGHKIYGLSLDEDAVPISEVEWVFPASLVFGEEKTGIPPDVEEMIDVKVAIPLYGMVSSINVGQAAAIAINAAVTALHVQNPDFEPARNASRRLMGLEEVIYETQPENQTETTESSD